MSELSHFCEHVFFHRQCQESLLHIKLIYFFVDGTMVKRRAPSPTVRVDVEITQTTTVEIIGTDSYCSISEREA